MFYIYQFFNVDRSKYVKRLKNNVDQIKKVGSQPWLMRYEQKNIIKM